MSADNNGYTFENTDARGFRRRHPFEAGTD